MRPAAVATYNIQTLIMPALHSIQKSRAGTLKILMVTEDLPSPSPGGLAQHVLTLAIALQREGHQVDILGSIRSGTTEEHLAPFPSFSGRFFPEIPPTRGWKEKPAGAFIPMKRSFAAKKLAETIIRYADDYDVVHYHGHMPDVARFLPVDTRFLQTRHDQGSECLTHTRFRQGSVCNETDPRSCANCITLKPNLLQKAVSTFSVRLFRKNVARAFSLHQVVFVSNSLRMNYVRTMGGNPDHIGMVIHNHVDSRRILPSLTHPRPAPFDEPAIRQVFVAGKISPGKGILEFVESIKQNLPSDMHLSIAGDGPEEQRLRDHCAHERINILGWCSYDQVITMASTADIIVVPSMWEESCPTTVHEALFLGKPTLALRRGGTPELVRYERYPGQLMLFDDIQSLTEYLRQFRPKAQPHSPDTYGVYGADIQNLLPGIIDQYRKQQSKVRII